ncbi:Suppressor of Sensor Kinase (SLN1), partial [Spiromyces aspiralis]
AVEVALKKVQEVLHRIDQVEDLYPTLKDFGEEVPKYAEPQFQDRLATLNTWSRDVILVRQLAAMLTKRMGNSDFFTQSSSGGIQDVKRNVLTDVLHEKDEDDLFRSHKQEGTILIHEHPQQQQQQQQQQPLPLPLATAKIPLPTKGGVIINGQEPFLDEDIQRMKPGMDISFAEKLLKEKGFKDTFRQRFLQQLSLTLKRVKDDMITYADRYASMNLPVTDKTLEMLVEFPSKLVKAILWLRLSYARRLVNLTNTQLEQTLADFHQSLELACK